MLKKLSFLVIFLFLLFSGLPLVAQTEVVDSSAVVVEKVEILSMAIDTLWVLIAGFLVFFMNLGFGMVEAGLARAKNTVNILTKNFVVFALASVAYWIIGFGLMFANGNAFMGTDGVLLVQHGVEGAYGALSWANVPLWAKFFFQLVFAGTAATIVSGAVAERIKFLAFIIFSFVLVGILYPITGHWIWGGGWLQSLGMFDFAGSTVVHSVGGWAALAGVMVLGPRLGKYRSNGTIAPIPGHNLSMVTLGGLVLWFGWFGFNPGSTMAVGDGSAIAHIAVTTNTGAVFAIISSTIVSWVFQKKPDLTMIINGALAGLVAVTAGCAFVTVESAAIIGFVAGILVVFSVWFFDGLKLDDPVGALSVHLVNGIWGTLAVGLFAVSGITGTTMANGFFVDGTLNLLGAQALGVVAVGGFTFGTSFIVWSILKLTMGIRVSKEEENSGLDLGEHGIEAYPDFQGFLTK